MSDEETSQSIEGGDGDEPSVHPLAGVENAEGVYIQWRGQLCEICHA